MGVELFRFPYCSASPTMTLLTSSEEEEEGSLDELAWSIML
jgi:hypothetical protein